MPYVAHVPHAPGTAMRQPAYATHPLPAPVLLVKADSGRGPQPRGAVAAQRLDIAFDYLFGLKSDPVQVAAVDEAHWFDVLDAMGPAPVLEAIAGGRLPAEIAISNRVPLTFFRKWMKQRIDGDALVEAMEIHAEVCVIKAQLVLLADVGSPQEAAMKRDLSQQLKWQAERADNKSWGPPGKAEPAPPAIYLNIDWGGVNAGSALRGPPALTIEGERVGNVGASDTRAPFDPFSLPFSPPRPPLYVDNSDERDGHAVVSEPQYVSEAAFTLAALPPFDQVFGVSPSRVRVADASDAS